MSTLYALFLWMSAVLSTDSGNCTSTGTATGARTACSATADDGASIYNGF